MPDESPPSPYETCFEHMPFACFIADESGALLEVNRAATQLSGYSRSELLHMSVPDLVVVEARRLSLKLFEQARRTGAVRAEVQMLRKDATIRVASLDAVALPGGRCMALCSDITQHRRDAELFATSMQRYELHVQKTPLGVIEWDLDFRVLEWNESAERIFGFTREEALGRHAMELIVPESSKPRVDAVWLGLLEHKDGRNSTLENLTKAGELIVCEWYYTPLVDLDGKTIGVASLVQDVTARKVSEEEHLAHLRLLESLERIDQAIRGPGELEEVLDEVLGVTLNILRCDRAFLIHPCAPETPVWHVVMERCRPEYPGALSMRRDIPSDPEIVALMEEVIERDAPVTATSESGRWLHDPEGVFSIRSLMVSVIHPKLGTEWAFGVHQCSYPRKWSEEEQRLFVEIGRRMADALSSLLSLRDLRESETRLRRIAENAPSMIYRMSLPDGRYEYVSPASEEIFGCTPEEFYAGELLIRDRIHPDWRGYFEEQWAKLLAGEMPPEYEYQIVHPDGETRWIHQRNVLIRGEEGAPIAIEGIVSDNTSRKRMEESLRRSEGMFRALTENTSECTVILDGGGSFTYASPSLRAALDFSPEELLRHRPEEFIHPEDVTRVKALFQRTVEEPGRTFPLPEFRARHRAGRWVPFEGVATGMFALEGVNGFVAHFRDIAERKLREEERHRFETRMLHAQKLESLGVLAGGIAHDFNNLLVAILGNADLALQDLRGNEPVREELEEIKKAARRAADLTNQMLAYSGRGRFVIQPVDLNEMVEEMGHILEVSISKKCLLRYELASPLPGVRADETQLRQVVMNLITNASDAVGEDSGVVRIRTYSVHAEPGFFAKAHVGEDAPAGEYVCLEVADTGCGMDDEEMARLFDPFYSTKFTGRGLGLAAVLGIVRGHRGAIKIESRKGHGSTFQVCLPVSEDSPVGVSEPDGAEDCEWRGSGLALVADDEESVRALARSMLEHLGYEVLVACDGADAVAIFEERGQEIDLVVLDLTMPVMGGIQTCERIRSLRPDAKVILTSGYGEEDATRSLGGGALAGFLQKPFECETLVRLLRSLDGERGRE